MCKLIGLIVLLSASSLLYTSGVSSENFMLSQNDHPAIALNNYLVYKNPRGEYGLSDYLVLLQLANTFESKPVNNAGFKNLVLQFKKLYDRKFTGKRCIRILGKIIKTIGEKDKLTVPRPVELVKNALERTYTKLAEKHQSQMASALESRYKYLLSLDKLVKRRCSNGRIGLGFKSMMVAIAPSKIEKFEIFNRQRLVNVAGEIKRQISDGTSDGLGVGDQVKIDDRRANRLLRKYLYQPCELFVSDRQTHAMAKQAVALTKVANPDYLEVGEFFEPNYGSLFEWATRYALCNQLLENRESNSQLPDEMQEYQAI